MAAHLHYDARIVEERRGYVHAELGPLPAGGALTLGHALRRALLAAVPGAAIVHARVEGADHQFATLHGMREDVSQLLFNLRGVRVRVASGRPAEMRLRASGAGTVTAADIESGSDCEIANPDHEIALLTTPDALLAVAMSVETGTGFRQAGPRPATASVGTIPMDALFAPVTNVLYETQPLGPGPLPDEQLDVWVHTDGTVGGAEALRFGAALLDGLLAPVAALAPADGHRTRGGGESLEAVPIEALGLGMRAYNALVAAGYEDARALAAASDAELRSVPRVGRAVVREVRARIAELRVRERPGRARERLLDELRRAGLAP